MFGGSKFSNLPAVDMHLHTVHCGHASDDMTLERIVRRAEQLGLKQIAVTEHVWSEQQLAVLEVLQEQFERIEPRILVRLGAEVDADPRYSDGRLVQQIPEHFRPLIVATHTYPDSTLLWYEDHHISRRTKRRLLKKWFEWAGAAVKHPNVDVLAHPGILLSREGPDVKFEAEILDRFCDLFGVMRSQNVCFEINEQVRRKLLSEHQQQTYHNLPVLAAELGVKFSVGSDSHSLDQIGQFDFCSRVSRQAGLQARDFYIYNGPGLVKGPRRPQ